MMDYTTKDETMDECSPAATQQHNISPTQHSLKPDMFDCPLCSSLLWEPITTSCGHSFCKSCILRAMDHDNKCPLCRAVILVTPEYGVSIILQQIIETHFPEQFKQRKQELEDELKQQSFYLPLFMLGDLVLFPKVSLPLHIFEPRYRLMLRRCLEGGKHFGIVPVINNQLATIGTTTAIENHMVFPDGRSLIQTTGQMRFRVLGVFDQDGYKVAKVEYLQDDPLPSDDKKLKKLQKKLEKAHIMVTEKLGVNLKQVEDKFGKMPKNSAADFCWWLGAVLPLKAEYKYSLLEFNSVEKRLEFLIYQMSEPCAHGSCLIS